MANANAQVRVKCQIEVPKYDGGDTVPTKYWTSCVNDLVPVIGDDAASLRQIAGLAMDSCTGKAKIACQLWKLKEKAGHDTWNVDSTADSLHKFILERFYKPSLQDILKLKAGCVQKSGEDVATFFDRVAIVAITLTEMEMPARGAEGPNNPNRLNDNQWAAQTEAWRNNIHSTLFLNGLKPQFKAAAMAREGELTLEERRNIAIGFEQTHSEQNHAGILAISVEDPPQPPAAETPPVPQPPTGLSDNDLQKIVAAVSSGKNDRGGRGGRGGSNRGNRSRGGRGGNRPNGQLGPCWTCNKMGHLQDNCFQRLRVSSQNRGQNRGRGRGYPFQSSTSYPVALGMGYGYPGGYQGYPIPPQIPPQQSPSFPGPRPLMWDSTQDQHLA